MIEDHDTLDIMLWRTLNEYTMEVIAPDRVKFTRDNYYCYFSLDNGVWKIDDRGTLRMSTDFLTKNCGDGGKYLRNSEE